MTRLSQAHHSRLSSFSCCHHSARPTRMISPRIFSECRGSMGGWGVGGRVCFHTLCWFEVDNRRDSHQQFGVNANRNGQDHKVKSHHRGLCIAHRHLGLLRILPVGHRPAHTACHTRDARSRARWSAARRPPHAPGRNRAAQCVGVKSVVYRVWRVCVWLKVAWCSSVRCWWSVKT